MANQLIPGAPIKIGNRGFIVPALSFGQLKKLRKEMNLTNAPAEMTEEVENALVMIIHAALSRNYPKLKLEELEDIIDLNNARPLIQAIKGESGFLTTVFPKEEETAAAGE